MSEPRLRKGSPPGFPALVQQFFTEYLVAQRKRPATPILTGEGRA